MAGSGRIPTQGERSKKAKPLRRGEWKPAPGIGWQHGPIPDPPDEVGEETREAWSTWFKAWYASHWSPHDLPGLLVVARLYDAVAKGDFTRSAELRMWSDNFGLTPKGIQDRRWKPPPADLAPGKPAVTAGGTVTPIASRGRYAHLAAGAGQEPKP